MKKELWRGYREGGNNDEEDEEERHDKEIENTEKNKKIIMKLKEGKLKFGKGGNNRLERNAQRIEEENRREILEEVREEEGNSQNSGEMAIRISQKL